MAKKTAPEQPTTETAPRGPALRSPVARRAFLAGSTAIAATAGYAAYSSGGGDAGPPDEQSADPRRMSYRETDHIRQFYARARF